MQLSSDTSQNKVPQWLFDTVKSHGDRHKLAESLQKGEGVAVSNGSYVKET